MPVLSVNGRAVHVPTGSTLLAAARSLGIRVPTLCHLADTAPLATCMVCLVEDRSRGRLVPACATRAEEGMCIDTDSAFARDARRTALELLLSEHAGECEAPCARACPLGIDLPEVLDDVAAGDLQAAWQRMRAATALPVTAARLCSGGCEKACRRRAVDRPVRARRVHGALAAWGLAHGRLPLASASGKRVTIVGAGPAGLAATDVLLAHGHACTLVDAHRVPGQSLRQPLAGDPVSLAALVAEIDAVVARGAVCRLGLRVGADVPWADVRHECDLLLLATGAAPGGIASLGVEARDGLVVVAPGTCLTSAAGVLAAGEIVHRSQNALRAMADGRAMGNAAQGLLSGVPAAASRRVCAQLGSVTREELEALRNNREQRCHDRAAVGARDDVSCDQDEARRCLGCGCRSALSCALRRLCQEHGVEPRRFSGARRRVEVAQEHALIRHEPGKCVLCGRCARLAESSGEALGLSVVGRGFSARMRVPLERPLAESLQHCALACAHACPTGALTVRAHARGGRP